MDAERRRLEEDNQREKNWKRWGPYLAERQWSTVREDYSADGSAWEFFPHDHSRMRAYRWGEDGLMGICDRQCRICFAIGLWNGHDAILKERLFGLTGNEGNHGEDVKECYYYLDSTPTHSYMKALYKYPQQKFPYEWLVEENGARKARGREEREFELEDTGIFDESKYWDVQAEYAKADDDDILIRITVSNRGPEEAELHLLPQAWFRNTWTWGCDHEGCWPKPWLKTDGDRILIKHPTMPLFSLDAEGHDGAAPQWLLTENQTNEPRLFGVPAEGPFKDAFHDFVIHRKDDAVSSTGEGTKAAAYYKLVVPAGDSRVIRARLRLADAKGTAIGDDFDRIFAQRIAEADAFYDGVIERHRFEAGDKHKQIMREAWAGIMWTKQFYHLSMEDWLRGDPNQPPPPPGHDRNADWEHLFNYDVLLMPDKWEYPWYAAWDLAFHALAAADIDPELAKQQMVLMLREWYMHPNGQLPAYEWAFSDVNPPVHAWAVWRIYKVTAPRGQRDRAFLESAFQKLLINFTWWVNRKDPQGRHIFAGGFLGMDNIAVFDRSQPLPTGGYLEQADGTAWMAFYCGVMLAMALELAQENPAYEDMASKFFEHYVQIIDAINKLDGEGLWNEEDGFYYDHILIHGHSAPLKLRSLVGLVPLIACEVIDEETLENLDGFRKRMDWFLTHKPELASHVSYMCSIIRDGHCHYLLAIPSQERLERVLKYMLDETEFLSDYGVRSLSKHYGDDPFQFTDNGQTWQVKYVPGESDTNLFGGNSNWRGPIWFPLNYLIIEALQRYHHYFGDTVKVELPTGSGNEVTLDTVACEIARRLWKIFLPREDGHRPWTGDEARYKDDPHWRDLTLFHEYFDGDNGRGLGASHQTGWTALVARLRRSEIVKPK